MVAKPLKITTWNSCSIRAKQIELADFLSKHEIDVGLFSETHLKPEDSFYLPNHILVRLDRTSSRGGGVAIAIKRGMKYSILPKTNTTVIEALSVEIVTPEGRVQLTAVYCPRQCFSTSELGPRFKRDLTAITRTNTRFIVGGDLNARHEDWRNFQRNQNGQLLFNHAQHGLYTVQYPDEPTFFSRAGNPSTLDLFLSNIVLSKPVAHNELSSDHLPVVAEVTINMPPAPRLLRKDYHHVNWAAFGRLVDRGIVENPMLNTTEDIDRSLEELQQAITVADETCIRRVPVRGKFLQIDSHTLLLIRLRNVCRRQFQRTGDPIKKLQIADLNKEIASRMVSLRNESFGRMVEKLDARSRPFWKVAKVLKSHPKPIPPLKGAESVVISPAEKANAIGEHIASSHLLGSCIGSPLEDEVHQRARRVDISPCVVPQEDKITPEQICSALKCAKNMKAPGFDGILNLVLKRLGIKVHSYLSAVFNRCLELSYFPKTWKVAKIIPIRKPGKDPSLPSSYRPISLLCALSKLFEKLLLNRLNKFVEEHDILLPEQFGFRKEHSTTHQLVRVINNINRNKAVSKSTAMAFLDVEKAFDNVWHDGLIYKLCTHNFPLHLIKITRNYLQHRSFKVSLNSSLSKDFQIPAGVPQGSLLGPLLYSIYTSDIPPLGDGSVLFLFADDTAIAVKGRMPREITSKLQRCLDTFVQYATSWKIKINPLKTQAVMFLYRQSPKLIPPPTCTVVMDGTRVEWSAEVSYLGLLFDHKLLFRSHVEKKLVNFAALIRSLYPLICRRSRLSVGNKLAVYKQIIQPAFLYASPVWESCAKTHRNKLQVAQNRALRMILDRPVDTRIFDLHQEADMPKLDQQIEETSNKFKSKCISSAYALISNLYIVG